MQKFLIESKVPDCIFVQIRTNDEPVYFVKIGRTVLIKRCKILKESIVEKMKNIVEWGDIKRLFEKYSIVPWNDECKFYNVDDYISGEINFSKSSSNRSQIQNMMSEFMSDIERAELLKKSKNLIPREKVKEIRTNLSARIQDLMRILNIKNEELKNLKSGKKNVQFPDMFNFDSYDFNDDYDYSNDDDYKSKNDNKESDYDNKGGGIHFNISDLSFPMDFEFIENDKNNNNTKIETIIVRVEENAQKDFLDVNPKNTDKIEDLTDVEFFNSIHPNHMLLMEEMEMEQEGSKAKKCRSALHATNTFVDKFNRDVQTKSNQCLIGKKYFCVIKIKRGVKIVTGSHSNVVRSLKNLKSGSYFASFEITNCELAWRDFLNNLENTRVYHVDKVVYFSSTNVYSDDQLLHILASNKMRKF